MPVLSKMAVRQVSIFSSTAGSLMMMPRRAASEIEPMIATGMAISSGQGVATTSTARKRVGSPLTAQASQGDGDGQRRVARRRAGRRAAAAAGGCCSESRITCMILA